ncbi:MAG: Mrp/NBP35 family ATP-binding protein [Erysipelotrichaceae bacterium]
MTNCNHDCANCSDSTCGSREQSTPKPMVGVNIKKVIAVTSGKGGVGKSMVSGLLADALNKKGYKVGIMDADITGPSIPKMFGVSDKIYGDGKGMYPSSTKNGIKMISVNLMLDNESDPVLWRGSLLSQMVQQFYTQVYWDELDFLIIDMPPGTGDIALTIYQSIPVNDIVIVTSPQDLVSMIVSKACRMAEMMNLNVLGLVENLSYMKCPCCNEKIAIFNDSHVDETAAQFNLDILAKLPLDKELASLADHGEIELNQIDYIDEMISKIIK